MLGGVLGHHRCFRSSRGVEVRILGRTLELLNSNPGTPSVSQFAYFTRTSMATCSALDVPRWCTHNGQKVKCETLNTSHSYWSLSWLHSRRGGTSNLFLATYLPSRSTHLTLLAHVRFVADRGYTKRANAQVILKTLIVDGNGIFFKEKQC